MNDANPERVRSALSFVDPSNRDLWVKMAFAIKSEFGEEGFEIWDDWGSQHARPAGEVKSTWRSAGMSGSGGSVQLGTLIFEAKSAGWVDDSKFVRPSKEEIKARQQRSAERLAVYQAEEAAAEEAAAIVANRLWAAAAPSDTHPYLARKGVLSHGLRVGNWEFTNPETGEVTTVPGCLLIPIRDRKRNIHSLQGIPAKGKEKYYLKDAAKRGFFYSLGAAPLKHDGRPVFVLGEGYATAASVHEATGHMTLVCFDASNLMAVAQVLRAAQPAAVIIMAADNDLATAGNPGVTIARKVAAAVDGLVAIPSLAGDPDAACDFNDLRLAEGDGPVVAFIGAVLNQPAVAPPQEEMDVDYAMEVAPDDVHLEQPSIDDVDPDLEDGHSGQHFGILGYDGDVYYIFHHAKKQILTRTRSDFGDAGLIELAPRDWWEMSGFGKAKGPGIDAQAAAEWIYAVAHQRGIYDPTHVRGRGAWRDKGRVVFHHGDKLTVDGETVAIGKLKSGFVYPMSRAMPSLDGIQPATDEQGLHLIQVAKMVRWTMPASAALLAGWTFLAPVCGALKWRPHIWITGPAGSGKSWIQSSFCSGLTAGIGENFQGSSTEPGIRQELKADAIPAIIDELEPNDEQDRKRLASILTMIRQASSESSAKTAKGTVSGSGMRFHIRSMFSVASISTMLDKESDKSRLTPLVIRPPAMSGADDDQWVKLEDAMHVILKDEDWPARLLARSIGMLPTILDNIDVFSRVAAVKFGTQRYGDQFGTLLAGAWCLCRGTVASVEQAAKMIESYDWSEHRDEGSPDDPSKALGALMEARVRVSGNEITIFELIADALNRSVSKPMDNGVAADTLSRFGIRIEGTEIAFASSSTALRDLVAKTPYYSDLRGQLRRLPGAGNLGNKTRKFSGIGSKCVTIPLSLIFDDDEPPI